MRFLRQFAPFLLPLMVLLAVACTRDSEGPPEEATPTPTPEAIGTIVYSGQWQGIGGTYTLTLGSNQVDSLSDVQTNVLQASGYADEFLFVHQTGKVYLAPFSSANVRLVADAFQAFLSPNGRKFFYNDPNGGGLYEGVAAGYGGLLFAADGAFGSHSPDLQTVAYLSAAGPVLASADGSYAPLVIDLASLLFPDEQFIIPNSGDFFPRWTPDGSMVAVPLLVEHTPSGFQRQLFVVLDTTGQRVVDISNGSEPIWNADGTAVYFLSNRQLYVFNIIEETTTLIAGGGNTACRQARLSDDGARLAFIQEDSVGFMSLITIDLETSTPTTVLPGSADGVLAMDWVRSSYCANENNTAPSLAVAVLIDGVATENPVVTPQVTAELQLSVSDDECNLEFGTAIWQTGDGIWHPLTTALPAGSGCAQSQVVVPVPANENGSYNLTVSVEDVCGTRSPDVTFAISYDGFSGDDDTTDDDTADDDTIDDDMTM